MYTHQGTARIELRILFSADYMSVLMTYEHPFDRLWVLKTEHAKLLERQSNEESNAPSWSGLVFLLANKEWVVSLKELNEIVMVGKLTPVPNVKPWLRGVFNLRGELLAVTDLAHFLNKQPTPPSKHNRILAIKHEDEWVGILVETVVTLIRVAAIDVKPIEEKALPEAFHPFVTEALVFKGKRLPIFHLRLLVEHPEFRRVSQVNTGMIG